MTTLMRATMASGVLALWMTLALVTALLVTPVETMALFDRDGAWGVPGAVRQGSRILVSAIVGAGRTGRS